MANIKRLKELYRFLSEEVPSRRFNLNDWGILSDKDSIKRYAPGKINTNLIKEGSCGTAACILGWASLNPVFKKQGLAPEPIKTNGLINGFYPQYTEKMKASDGAKPHMFSGFDAAEKFFEIGLNDAVHLFDPSMYQEGRSSLYYAKRRLLSFINRCEKDK